MTSTTSRASLHAPCHSSVSSSQPDIDAEDAPIRSRCRRGDLRVDPTDEPEPGGVVGCVKPKTWPGRHVARPHVETGGDSADELIRLAGSHGGGSPEYR